MNILLSGMNGRMGRELLALAKDASRGCRIIAGIDKNQNGTEPVPCFRSFPESAADADVLIDFSDRSLTRELLCFAVRNRLPSVLCTTGHTVEEQELIRQAAETIPVFCAANCSAGTALLAKLAKEAARLFPDADIEIIETHHADKTDAPSGTALRLAEELKAVRPTATNVYGRNGTNKRVSGEIGIHSVRLGGIVGIHEIKLGTPSQTITLRHEAHSRAVYAEGALAAAAFIAQKPPGLYGMKELTGLL